MFTEQFFYLLLDFGADWIIKEVRTDLQTIEPERLNGKIQRLKSIGRGYRKFENFGTVILCFYGKLDLSPLNFQLNPKYKGIN